MNLDFLYRMWINTLNVFIVKVSTMRINDILAEGSKDDLAALTKIADVVISSLPDTIGADSMFVIEGNHFTKLDKKKLMTELPARYKYYVDHLLFNTKYTFVNKEDAVGDTAGGAHRRAFRHSEIIIVLSVMFGNADVKTRNEIATTKLTTGSMHSVRSVMVHEMRHAIQSEDYPKFINKQDNSYGDGKEYDYGVDPLEIDAAWMHHLHDREVSDYPDSQTFVSDVMDAFARYKTLSDKQHQHYWRKAAKYYHDVESGNVEQLDLRQRKDLRDKEFLDSFKTDIMDSLVQHKDTLSDLRNFTDRELRNFILPVDAFTAATTKLLSLETNKGDVVEKNICYVYGFLGMLSEVADIELSKVQQFVRKRHGIDWQYAVSYIEENGFGRFDKELFTSLIKNNFSSR